jgi:hypothetical protein
MMVLLEQMVHKVYRAMMAHRAMMEHQVPTAQMRYGTGRASIMLNHNIN